jgi:hypothetical protein
MEDGEEVLLEEDKKVSQLSGLNQSKIFHGGSAR